MVAPLHIDALAPTTLCRYSQVRLHAGSFERAGDVSPQVRAFLDRRPEWWLLSPLLLFYRQWSAPVRTKT